MDKVRTCGRCGEAKPITPKFWYLRRDGKPSSPCRECRLAERRATSAARMAAREKRSCAVCGGAVTSTHPRALYCSVKCQKRAAYCRSNGLPLGQVPTVAVCPVCGTEIHHRTGLKPKTYCSDRCRIRARGRRTAGAPVTNPTRFCRQCGLSIPPDMKRSAVYCSTRCRNQAAALRYLDRENHRAEARARNLDYRHAAKQRVIAAYGGRCECCGDTDPRVLTIDHIQGGGRRHRSTVGYGLRFYQWLETQGFPMGGYRLLCMNCNCGRERNLGVCPHEGSDGNPSPFDCVVCGTPLPGTDGQKPVCETCRTSLKAQHGTLALPNCLLCGKPLTKPPKGGRYFCEGCAQLRQKERARRIVRGYLEKVASAYGGHCARCGEDNLLFLTVDHVEGGGGNDRRLGRAGSSMYQWLIGNDYPPGFQVLCWNCNWKKGPGSGIARD